VARSLLDIRPYAGGVDEQPQTWHYGVMARCWAENTAEPEGLAYYGAAIERFGQPALDLGRGTGRILLPLLAAGYDVEGIDISADMLRWPAAPAPPRV